jgi:MtN3 and saliva related transmembrane protein
MTAHDLAGLAGSLGGLCSVGAFFPQIYRIVSRRSADDVSFSMYIIIMFGAALWIFYAYMNDSTALLVTNVAIFIIGAVIAGLRLRFGRKGNGVKLDNR